MPFGVLYGRNEEARGVKGSTESEGFLSRLRACTLLGDNVFEVAATLVASLVCLTYQEYIISQPSLFSILFAIPLMVWVAKNYSAPLATLLIYIVARVNYPFLLGSEGSRAEVMDWVLSLKGLGYWLLMFGAAHVFMHRKRVYITGAVLLLLTSFWLILSKIASIPSGLFPNLAFNGGFIGVLAPFIAPLGWLKFLLPIVAIACATGASGIVVGTATIVSYFWQVTSGKLLRTILFPLLALATAATLYAFTAGHFTESDRLAIYQLSLQYVTTDINRLVFGSGLGSWMTTGMPLALKSGIARDEGLWMFLHSDWLQCLFELGLVGMGLTLAVFVECLVVTYQRRPILFSSLLGAGIFGVFYFPMQLPGSAFVVMCLVVASLRGRDEAE